MPYNGNGIFARIHNWAIEAASGTPILPGEFDEQEQDFASAFSNCITRDGQGGPSADIPWNNFGITGLRAPQLAGDAANKAYVDTATGARSMGGYKLTSLADPTNPQDAATMAYVGGTTTQLPAQAGNAGKALVTNGAIASWKLLGTLPRSARNANTQLLAADLGSLIDITGGTFTQTFDTAANLGANWYAYIRNSGTGNITIPSSDGVAGWIMYPGEVRLFQCDGATFNSIVLQGFYLSTQISGNFIRPPGYNVFKRRLTPSGAGGGGGGGGGSGASGNGSTAGVGGTGGTGGNSGSAADDFVLASILPASTAYLVGAGGVGGNGGVGGSGVVGASGNPGVAGSAGGAGNPTTFGANGQPYYLSAAATTTGGVAGNLGSQGFAGANSSPTSGVSPSAAALTFSGTGYGVINLPSFVGGSSVGTAGGNGNVPSAGSAGGVGSTSIASNTGQAGGVGGAAGTVLGNVASNGTTPAKAPAGCGGAGGGGGGGSIGSTAGAATGNGGNGAKGGDGGDGKLEIWGVL